MTKPANNHSRRRIPKPKFTIAQCIGYHANYRDPVTGTPRRKRFGMIGEQEARVLYSKWLAEYMADPPAPNRGRPIQAAPRESPRPLPAPGTLATGSTVRSAVTRVIDEPRLHASLLSVADSLIRHEEARSRPDDAPRSRGTICERVTLSALHISSVLKPMSLRSRDPARCSRREPFTA